VELAKIPEKPELMLGDSGRYESVVLGSQKKKATKTGGIFIIYKQTTCEN